MADKPALIAGHAVTTGAILRQGFENVLPAPEPSMAQTVQALHEIDPDDIIPMPWSGAGFSRMVQQKMPDQFLLSSTGSRYLFGA